MLSRESNHVSADPKLLNANRQQLRCAKLLKLKVKAARESGNVLTRPPPG